MQAAASRGGADRRGSVDAGRGHHRLINVRHQGISKSGGGKGQCPGGCGRPRKAEDQKNRAETNAVEARRKTKEAEEEKHEAEREKEKAEDNLYVSRIALAHQKWLSGEVNETNRLLKACPARLRHWEWGYLNHLLHMDLFTLRGHSGEAHSVCFSPDGKRLATGSRDNTAKVWDAASGKELLTLRGHTGPVNSVCFSPDGTQLATARLGQHGKDLGRGQRAGVAHPLRALRQGP